MADFFKRFGDDNIIELVNNLTATSFTNLECCSTELQSRLRPLTTYLLKLRLQQYLWLTGDNWNTTQWINHYIHLRLQRHPPCMFVVGGSSNRNNHDSEQWLKSCEYIDCSTTHTGETKEDGGTHLPPNELSVARDACAITRHPETHTLYVSGGWDGETCHSSIESLTSTSREWVVSAQQTLIEPRCFHAAVYDREHGHLLMGGSSNLFQGAVVSRTMEQHLPTTSSGSASSPRLITDMLHKRAGHLASLNPLTRDIVVCGGYGGETVYHDTVEVLCLNNGMDSAFQALPTMSTKKTGAGGGFGPGGCMWVCGGSTNGSDGLTRVERLDLRMKKWETMAPLTQGRGYCSAAWSADGRLYCAGGSVLRENQMLHNGTLHTFNVQETWDTIEVFDPRKGGEWVVLGRNLMVERADLCLTSRLTTSRVAVDAILRRENPVVDVWQSRRMRTLST